MPMSSDISIARSLAVFSRAVRKPAVCLPAAGGLSSTCRVLRAGRRKRVASPSRSLRLVTVCLASVPAILQVGPCDVLPWCQRECDLLLPIYIADNGFFSGRGSRFAFKAPLALLQQSRGGRACGLRRLDDCPYHCPFWAGLTVLFGRDYLITEGIWDECSTMRPLWGAQVRGT